MKSTATPVDDHQARVRASSADLIHLRHYAQGIRLEAGLVRSRQTGNRLSAFKGRGMDYEESRRYQQGDDRRNLDWRVMARTGKPYTKLFREERERPVYLCTDVSPSMHFATRGSFKSVVAARALALLGWAAFAHGDRVGGLVYGGPVRLERRPARGKRSILNWIHDVCRDENWLPEDLTDKAHLSEKLQRIYRVSRPGSLLAIASDWRDLDSSVEQQLLKLAQHNSLLLIFVYDKLEKELPPPGTYAIADEGRVLSLDSRGRQRRELYAEQFSARRENVRRLARQLRAVCIEISTDDDPVKRMLDGLH